MADAVTRARTLAGATLFLAGLITVDAALGADPVDRWLAASLGGIVVVVVVGAALTRLRGRRFGEVLALAAVLQCGLLVAMLWRELGSVGPVVVINGLLSAGYGVSAWMAVRTDVSGGPGAIDGGDPDDAS